MLYPLKFKPILKSKIWGGNKLESLLNKDLGKENNIGESWELSAVEGNESVVVNGFLAENTISELVEVYMDDLVGGKIFDRYGFNFPLLFKFIDANDDLSVQVHPDNEMAKEKYGSCGKSEMWYVLYAEPKSKLYLGFNGEMDREKCEYCINNGSLEKHLFAYEVKKGDAFFIPAGMVHSIGKGIVLAEIQQSSDITYRLYDYNRKDKNGNLRSLQINDALDALDYNIKAKPIKYEYNKDSVNLVDCDFFVANIISLSENKSFDYIDKDSFVVYMCLDGSFDIKYQKGVESIKKGQTVLLPADIGEIEIVPESKVNIIEIWGK